MYLIFDLVFIAIILISIFMAAKRGFVRALLEFIGFFVAIVIALTVSEPASQFAFEKFVEPAIYEKTQDIITDTSTEIPENLWENLPDFIKNNSVIFNFDKESFQNTLSNEIKDGASNLSDTISQKIVKPSFISVVSAIICFLLILILIPVFRFLAKVINKLFSSNKIGKVNKTLGGIVGIINGIAICFGVCILLNLLIKISGGGFWVITGDVLNKSFVFSKIFPLIT